MSSRQHLEFEKPVIELESKLKELEELYVEGRSELKGEVAALAKKVTDLKKRIFSGLTPWQITQLARHPNRPYTLDYISHICEDFIELHGDRCYGDDAAIVGGLARIDGRAVVLIGHQKGRTTKEKIHRNFGMPNPEGYRKAMRLMRLAERFERPVVTFIDTPGAFPGIGAEERGQAEAIATSLMVMSGLRVPSLSVIIGEGGSGGALAIGVADKVMMMEYSTYSVISPEGCAAILWKNGGKADVAARSLKITARDLLKLGIIDKVIKEPLGAAHSDTAAAAKNMKKAIVSALGELDGMERGDLLKKRYDKYRGMGIFKGD